MTRFQILRDGIKKKRWGLGTRGLQLRLKMKSPVEKRRHVKIP